MDTRYSRFLSESEEIEEAKGNLSIKDKEFGESGVTEAKDKNYYSFLDDFNESEDEDLDESKCNRNIKDKDFGVNEAKDKDYYSFLDDFNESEDEDLDEAVEIPSDYATRKVSEKDLKQIPVLTEQVITEIKKVLNGVTDPELFPSNVLRKVRGAELNKYCSLYHQVSEDLDALVEINRDVQVMYKAWSKNYESDFIEFMRPRYKDLCAGILEVYDALDELKDFCEKLPA